MHHLPKAMQYRQAHWAIFFTKLSTRRVSQVRSLTPNFTVVALEMWAYRRRNSKKLLIFGIILRKGVYPLTNFCKIWRGEGLPGSHPHTKFLPLWLSKCGLTAQKSPKMVIFGINFPLSHFYKILPGGEIPKTAPHAKFHRCSFKNVAVRL